MSCFRQVSSQPLFDELLAIANIPIPQVDVKSAPTNKRKASDLPLIEPESKDKR